MNHVVMDTTGLLRYTNTDTPDTVIEGWVDTTFFFNAWYNDIVDVSQKVEGRFFSNPHFTSDWLTLILLFFIYSF